MENEPRMIPGQTYALEYLSEDTAPITLHCKIDRQTADELRRRMIERKVSLGKYVQECLTAIFAIMDESEAEYKAAHHDEH